MQPIILASQSPRRRQLLEWAEVPFEVMISDTDERYPEHLSPAEVALYIAREKAEAVLKKYHGRAPVLAADTIVYCRNQILGKPTDHLDALRMLKMIQGHTHEVITAVVIRQGSKEIAFTDSTEVAFHALDDRQLEYYISRYKPYDKAGAYAIQEWIGVVGIAGIRGDFYNVMGLPVSRVVQALQTLEK